MSTTATKRARATECALWSVGVAHHGSSLRAGTMSTPSPEKERRKPAQQSYHGRNSTITRDNPLFATRRMPSRAHRREFFTDSTNTSYIPSPSPTKSALSLGGGANPRQDRRNGRSLAAAFKATPDVTDENKPPSSSSSERRYTQPALRPRTTPSRLPTSPQKSLKRLPQDPTKVRTPSPARGRQDSLLSPTSSASSPPRGLAEAYQRIEDEEFLAGQEDDSVDDIGDEVIIYERQDRSLDRDSRRLQRIRESASPISLRTSRRSSRGPIEEVVIEEEEAGQQENNTQGSDENSQMSFPSNASDDALDGAMTQYAKDEQRLKEVLRSDARPFRKAHLGERVGLTAENLRRRNGSNDSGSSTLGSGSSGSRASDMQLNIPRDWGRKARTGKDWLSRINSRSGRFTGDVPKAHNIEDANIPSEDQRRFSEPNVDWSATAADVPLPSVEDSSSQAGPSSRNSTPNSMVRRNPSLDTLREWEINEDDFTARSLQFSDSPPVRIRNTTLDRIREREIETLEKSALTTNRLGELREKKSLEHIRRRSPSVPAVVPLQEEEEGDENAKDNPRPSWESSLKPSSEDGMNARDHSTVPGDLGDTNPDTPIVIYKGRPEASAAIGVADRRQPFPTTHPSQRPSHERQDSRDLLRRLARVTSASPSPSPTRVERDGNMPGHLGKAEKVHSKTSLSDPSTKPVESNLGDGNQSSNETHPAAATNDDEIMTGFGVDRTPQMKRQNIHLKTPLVTGAWIDTPLPTGGRGPPMPTPAAVDVEKELLLGVEDELVKLGAQDLMRSLGNSSTTDNPAQHTPLAETAPSLPKSALAAILNKAKHNNNAHPRRHESKSFQQQEKDQENDTLHLDDSTIQSLEALIANDTDLSTLLAPSAPRASSTTTTTTESQADKPPPTSPQQTQQQQQELHSYAHLTSRLSKLGLSIRDAKKGIASLEQAISSATPSQQIQKRLTESTSLATATASGHGNANRECTEGGEFHDFIWPCESCGCRGGGREWGGRRRSYSESDSDSSSTKAWEMVRIPVPKLWTWKPGDWRPRATWLGIVTAVAWGLLIGELVAWYVLPAPSPCPHTILW